MDSRSKRNTNASSIIKSIQKGVRKNEKQQTPKSIGTKKDNSIAKSILDAMLKRGSRSFGKITKRTRCIINKFRERCV